MGGRLNKSVGGGGGGGGGGYMKACMLTWYGSAVQVLSYGLLQFMVNRIFLES